MTLYPSLEPGKMSLHPSYEHDKMDKLRRQKEYEDERAIRIHNPKRKMGHDVVYLEAQIREKQAREAIERREKLDYDERQIQIAKYLKEEEIAQRNAKCQQLRDDIAFNMEFVRKEQAREYDINDPAYLHHQPKIRVDHVDHAGHITPDPNLPVSSGQVFEGEDLDQPFRAAREAAELNAIRQEEMKANAAKRALERQEQNNWDQQQLALNQYLKDQEDQQRAAATALQKEIQKENLAAAEQARHNKAYQKQLEQEQERQHLKNFADTNMMAERSRPGMVDEYRGQTKEQIEAYNRDLLRQLEEAKAKRALQQTQKMQDDAVELSVNQYLRDQENQKRNARNQLEMEIATENKNNIYQQKYLNNKYPNNSIDGYFQDQFDKYCR